MGTLGERLRNFFIGEDPRQVAEQARQREAALVRLVERSYGLLKPLTLLTDGQVDELVRIAYPNALERYVAQQGESGNRMDIFNEELDRLYNNGVRKLNITRHYRVQRKELNEAGKERTYHSVIRKTSLDMIEVLDWGKMLEASKQTQGFRVGFQGEIDEGIIREWAKNFYNLENRLIVVKLPGRR